jgi:hypothetical protein
MWRGKLWRDISKNARFVEEVVKGLVSLDRGEFVPHADVGRRIERLLGS